jgi:hypothetical protein
LPEAFGLAIDYPLLLLLARNGAARAFARTGVCFAALTTHRQTPAVTQAAVTAQIGQTLDVHGYFTAKVAFHGIVIAANNRTNFAYFIFTQILDANFRADARLGKNLLGRAQANAEDVGQCDLNTLLNWDVYTGYASHGRPPLTLPLFMARVFANNTNHALATNHTTFVTHFLD